MSRSRKKVWGWTDHRSPHSKIAERLTNKKVRHTESFPNGGAYKKIFCSWETYDYEFLYFHRSQVDREDD
ncbi:MAG: hypothetical protein JSV89_03205 [Spirochaetaceae bacterium]|nr:MAG: hypothetical protein JSV89_03205 [Spirochaetaceae bacterium]